MNATDVTRQDLIDFVVHEARLLDAKRQAGPGSVEWDGRDARGNPVGSGVYLYRLSFEGSRRISRKMVLLK